MTQRPDFRTGNLPKRFFDGTQRTVSPQETIERARPHFKRMGLTRVADLTGLDRIGLPVAQAVRPAARSLSVNQGKGQTRAAAHASAIMESLETWHAEVAELKPVFGPRAAISAKTPCASLSGISSQPDISAVALETTPMDWTMGWELVRNEPIALPYDCVHMNYTQPQQTGFVHRTSNGLASGNSLAEAATAALLELVERDANAQFRVLSDRQKRQRRLNMRSLEATCIWPIIDRIQSAGLWLEVYEMTNDIGIPVFFAMVFECRGAPEGGIQRPFYGAGCHLDSEIALSRAVTEAVQSRLTVISGARDDLVEEDFRPIPGTMLSLMTATGFEAHVAPSFCSVDLSGPTSLDDMTTIRSLLRKRGLTQIITVDLTHPEIGIPVVRAVVPGLGGPAGGGTYRLGCRHLKDKSRKLEEAL